MAELTPKRRKALPKSSFALPGKAPASGSYPIPDKAHARAALSRGAQHASPSELATIKRKVAARYPDIQQAGKPKPKGKS